VRRLRQVVADLSRLGLRLFFLDFFPVAKTEELYEEMFALTYNMKGITWSDLQEMPSREREFLVERLHRQLKAEVEAMKRAGKVK
jgi:hypothetical protein